MNTTSVSPTRETHYVLNLLRGRWYVAQTFLLQVVLVGKSCKAEVFDFLPYPIGLEVSRRNDAPIVSVCAVLGGSNPTPLRSQGSPLLVHYYSAQAAIGCLDRLKAKPPAEDDSMNSTRNSSTQTRLLSA